MKSLETAIAGIARENLGREEWNVPLDYFSWGRDNRHNAKNTESLPTAPMQAAQRSATQSVLNRVRSYLKNNCRRKPVSELMTQFTALYADFDKSYQLMSDESSRTLFAELVFMKLVTENRMRLSSFTRDFIDSYEEASKRILNSGEKIIIYERVLHKIALDGPSVSFFTVPTILNLHLAGRLYRYRSESVLIQVQGGDIVIDAGVGWGDTSIYMAALAAEKPGGHVYSFDILEEGIGALLEQIKINPGVSNITTVTRALSDKDNELVNISLPGPGAAVLNEETERKVSTITIDTFTSKNSLPKVDFIKMDIEGAEVPALLGARKTIMNYKPKLAISVYHKWDDLLVIPQLIHGLRPDYNFYLDCTTGFGGEAVLYCN